MKQGQWIKFKGRKMRRPDWDEYFMMMCQLAAMRSTCERRGVGAVLVKDNQVLATGYNGPPKNNKHCGDRGGCMRESLKIPSGERDELCRAVHAEANCVAQGAQYGVGIKGSTLICTNFPCNICAKLIINSGIIEVAYQHFYNSELAIEMLAESGIHTRKIIPKWKITIEEIEHSDWVKEMDAEGRCRYCGNPLSEGTHSVCGMA